MPKVEGDCIAVKMCGQHHALPVNQSSIRMAFASPDDSVGEHLLPGAIKNPSPAVDQEAAAFTCFKIFRLEFATQQIRSESIRQRSQRFDQIHQQCGAIIVDGMKEAHAGIQARGNYACFHFSEQEGVREGQDGTNRVGWWALLSALEDEGRIGQMLAQPAGEGSRGGALMAAQHVRRTACVGRQQLGRYFMMT